MFSRNFCYFRQFSPGPHHHHHQFRISRCLTSPGGPFPHPVIYLSQHHITGRDSCRSSGCQIGSCRKCSSSSSSSIGGCGISRSSQITNCRTSSTFIVSCRNSSSNSSGHIGSRSSRPFSKVSDNQATELYFEEIFDNGFEGEDPIHDLRNYFYPECKDADVKTLSNATSVSEVVNCVTEIEKPSYQHITQALATLHHLQKLCNFLESGGGWDQQWQLREKFLLFNSQLERSDKFQALLQLINDRIEEIPFRETAFILMVLRKFSVPLSLPLMQRLYLRLVNNLSSLSMEPLSYLTVALRPRPIHVLDIDKVNGCVWRMGLLPIIPRLEKFLEECESPEELRRIAICFNSISILVSDKMMRDLRNKVYHLAARGELAGQKNFSLLNKLLSLVLNKYDWHAANGDYVKLILQQHQGYTEYLRPINAILVSKVLRNFGQPVELQAELYGTLCENINSPRTEYVPSIVILSHILKSNHLAMPVNELERKVRQIIDSDHLVDNIAEIYDIMKVVSFSDRSIYGKFFHRSLELLSGERSEIRRLASRYGNMHNIYTGPFHDKEFELAVSPIIFHQLMDTHFPKEFAEGFGIYLSMNNDVPDKLLDRFYDFLPQLNPFSLMTISVGLDHQLKGQKRNYALLNNRNQQDEKTQTIDEIIVAVNKASLSYLYQSPAQLNTDDLSFLFRNFTRRRSLSAERIFPEITRKIFTKIEEGKLSPFIANQLVISMDSVTPRMELPDLVDRLVQYYVGHDDLHARMYLRLSDLCYRINHAPSKPFLQLVAKSLLRDLDSMYGLRVLEAGISLAAFDHLTEEIARAIFSTEFMSRLDKELEMCGNSPRYTRLARDSLMVLNRACVLQFPSYQVPWFHHKYCQEHQKDLSRRPASEAAANFRSQVFELLCEVTGGWKCVKENSFSEYYNHVDYEVGFDADNNPVDLFTTEASHVVRRVAVQVYDKSEFTYDTRRLLGKNSLTCRQLELQGWQVLALDPFSWDSMCMAEQTARREYLNHTLHTATT